MRASSLEAADAAFFRHRTAYLRFSHETVDRTEHIGTSTRDEMVILDYDASGRIVGIELIGDELCQQR
jgi:uncharacterized protein YuzE